MNLLIPLYLVVAAGTLARLLPRRRILDRPSRLRPPRADAVPDPAAPRTDACSDWLLLGARLLYAVQALYSADISKALENMAFFYVPFALLYMLLREVRWTRELLLLCLGVAVAEAVVFAGIGFIEYGRKELLLNPKVVRPTSTRATSASTRCSSIRTSTVVSWRW